MSGYTIFENINELDTLDTLDDSKISRILIEGIDNNINNSVSNAYQKRWSNNWFNKNENDIKTLYYKKTLSKNVINKINKPTKVNDIILPGIIFEGD